MRIEEGSYGCGEGSAGKREKLYASAWMFQSILAREEEPLSTRDWLVRLGDSGHGLSHQMGAMAGIQCCEYRLIRAEILRALNSTNLTGMTPKLCEFRPK
jgi:hypothetical protein